MPSGIARCADTADVRESLLWAQANQVPLVARSGGHSYAGFSLTNGLMIDLSVMRGVEYDDATGIVKVEGGARNSTVYDALRPKGSAVTHGRCLEVGVAGLVLGGGIGFNMRLHGLTSDGLIETEMVTADGELLTCNRAENTDLFWACQGGGGGNFGINTSFTFQSYPVTTLTVFDIRWLSQSKQVAAALLTLLPQLTRRLGAKIRLQVKPQRGVEVQLLGQLDGTETELRTLLSSVFALQSPSQEQISTLSYWDAQAILSEDGAPEYSQESSRYVYQALSSQALDTIFDYLHRWPGTSRGADWKVFLMGGKIDDTGRSDSAYVHRGASYLSSVELEWTEADQPETVLANLRWLENFHAAIEPHTSKESYQNFIDRSQSGYLEAYYGENLERLVEIKRRYDSRNVFSYPQSIPLSL